MRINKLWITALLALFSWNMSAHVPDYALKASKKKVQYRGVCASSESQIDMEINNVRARLLGGGDCWWDFTNGRYIVPKVDVTTGQREVSSIFAGSVWLGGVDPSGNLKLACQDYRTGGRNDFWPGPLSEIGVTDELVCDNWDRHFRVTGDEIRRHLANLLAGDLNPDNIPRGVKGWPARGNPYFADVWGFDLPYTQQALAGFFDADQDNDYDPLKGDYPSIEIRGCPLDRYPDEMVFWIYNDQGGGAPHALTGGTAIQMEVQVQAFSYLTNDELNDMTFQRYKLINRATERIDSTFFAMWVDPDLGCFLDDYIGCDSTYDLMYVYNQDATDGDPGCECSSASGQVNTYCEKVPILGVDYFRGPLDTFGNEIGMSSFVYYNNPSYNAPDPLTTDPQSPIEFYRYLTGHWRDGQPFTYGGNGKGGTEVTRYALSDPPNDPNGWSMCTADLPLGDRRTLQASGPFTLLPGAVNELIIGIPWVPDIDYPCPDLEGLFRADFLAQGLFDNCFELLDGPDAPNVDWIELNKQVIAILTNDSISNNFNEAYEQIDFLAPDSLKDSPDPDQQDLAKYKFEGYRIYQLINPNVSTSEFNDPDKSRPVYQVDVKNGVKAIYNWSETRDPATNNRIFFPVQQVDGGDQGLRRTFPILDDKFATGNDKSLINHKKYYFAVIAYAYNNYDDFNPLAQPVSGQQRPYLPGRKAADGQIKIYTVIPRPIVDQELNSEYGDGVAITRIEGAGSGSDFLDLEPDSRDALFSGNLTDTTLTYRGGQGPITVTIFNPFEVKDGDYELRFVDSDNTDTKLDKDARWELRLLPNGEVIASQRTIAELNEQLILEYGFSVTISQAPLTGSYTWSLQAPDKYINPGESNGAIGASIEYANQNEPWLLGIPDQEVGFFHYVKTRKLERDADFDPFQGLSTLGNGWFVPYVLCDWDQSSQALGDRFFTPAWTPASPSFNSSVVGGAQEPTNSGSRYFKLANLPNVDIVLTSDTSKWSRCIVVESANRYYTDNAFPKDPALRTESPPNKTRVSFDARYALSVGKSDADGDGLPDPDGATNANGTPVRGMGWFPGYAIDVETGRRLNIFFGENSCYTGNQLANSNFRNGNQFWLATTGWNFVADGAVHTPGSTDSLGQNIPALQPNADYEVSITIADMTAGNLRISLGQGQTVEVNSNGTTVLPVRSGEVGMNFYLKPSSDFNGRVVEVKLIDPLKRYTGRDMLWNPTNHTIRNPGSFTDYYDLVLGGQHWVYVMYSSYDGCEKLRTRLTPELSPTSNSDIFKVSEMKNVAWAGMVGLAQNYQMRSLREGLIPNDAVIKLRVSKPYTTWFNDADNGAQSGHPIYQLRIRNSQAQPLDAVQIENALDSVKVVPNPYYGFSQYENTEFTTTIKITNLPAKCRVTIYSLDGKFIRQYNREEVYAPYMQIAPDLEWDLKNNKGIPVASGVYLIQVQAPGMGERTIKWFGISRKFDPSSL